MKGKQEHPRKAKGIFQNTVCIPYIRHIELQSFQLPSLSPNHRFQNILILIKVKISSKTCCGNIFLHIVAYYSAMKKRKFQKLQTIQDH